MVKHIILWTFKEELNEIEKAGIKNGIKRGIEGLRGKIDGLVDMEVYIKPLETSNTDAMLVATFKDLASLKAYKDNPLHLEVANSKVRPYLSGRACMDFNI